MCDLKTCPFCGGSNIHEIYNAIKYIKYFLCVDCNATGPTSGKPNTQEAIAAWNTRAENKRIEELEDALTSIIGQTDDCEADETYYSGVWREVNFTARQALKGEG